MINKLKRVSFTHYELARCETTISLLDSNFSKKNHQGVAKSYFNYTLHNRISLRLKISNLFAPFREIHRLAGGGDG